MTKKQIKTLCTRVNSALCNAAIKNPPNLKRHHEGWQYVLSDIRTTLNLIESLADGDRSAADGLTINEPRNSPDYD